MEENEKIINTEEAPAVEEVPSVKEISAVEEVPAAEESTEAEEALAEEPTLPEREEGEPTDEEFDVPDEPVPAPKKKTRVLAGALAVLVVVAMVLGIAQPFGMKRGSNKSGIFYAATGIPTDAVLMKVDDRAVTAERYFYWLASACNAVSYYMGEGVGFDSDTGTGETYADFCRTYALGSVQEYAAIEAWAEQFGWTLSEEENAAIEDELAAYQEQYGDFIFNYWGFGPDTMRYLYRMNIFYQKAQTAAQTADGELFPSEEEIAAYREETGYMKADQIFLATIDLTTGEALSDEAKAEKKARMEELRAEVLASDDIAATFAKLADENSEDTGRAAYPDGYVFNDATGFVTEFTDAAKSVEVGEVSAIAESEMGYHLLLRKELSDEELLKNGNFFEILMDKTTAAQEIRYSKTFENEVAAMDIGAFNETVLAERDALLQTYQAAQTGGDGSGNAGEDEAGAN